MPTNLKSSAPHIAKASSWQEDLVDWGGHLEPIDGNSTNCGRLLWKGAEDGLPEAGVWICTPGSWRLVLPRDEFCYFVAGRGRYCREDGEVVEITPGTLVHFREGWSGEVTIEETTRAIYMLR
jgi:hypothetical protein